MTDIRIVEAYHEQPTLFGAPLKIITYQLVNWETDELMDKHHYETMGEAERASYTLLRPYLAMMAVQEVERNSNGHASNTGPCTV